MLKQHFLMQRKYNMIQYRREIRKKINGAHDIIILQISQIFILFFSLGNKKPDNYCLKLRQHKVVGNDCKQPVYTIQNPMQCFFSIYCPLLKSHQNLLVVWKLNTNITTPVQRDSKCCPNYCHTHFKSGNILSRYVQVPVIEKVWTALSSE